MFIKKILILILPLLIHTIKPVEYEIYTDATDLAGTTFIEVFKNRSTSGKGYYFNSINMGYVSELNVDAEKRNRGIGSEIFQCLISKMFTYGCTKIEWDAIPEGSLEERKKLLPSLIRFYEKNGGVVEQINKNGTEASMYISLKEGL